jgi:hypothetical protein
VEKKEFFRQLQLQANSLGEPARTSLHNAIKSAMKADLSHPFQDGDDVRVRIEEKLTNGAARLSGTLLEQAMGAVERAANTVSLQETLPDAMPGPPDLNKLMTRLEDPLTGGKPIFPSCQSCHADVTQDTHEGRKIWVCTKYGRVLGHFGPWPDGA